MVDKLGTFTANFINELGKKLVEKGIMTNAEMQEIITVARNETDKQQKKQKEKEGSDTKDSNSNGNKSDSKTV